MKSSGGWGGAFVLAFTWRFRKCKLASQGFMSTLGSNKSGCSGQSYPTSSIRYLSVACGAGKRVFSTGMRPRLAFGSKKRPGTLSPQYSHYPASRLVLLRLTSSRVRAPPGPTLMSILCIIPTIVVTTGSIAKLCLPCTGECSPMTVASMPRCEQMREDIKGEAVRKQ